MVDFFVIEDNTGQNPVNSRTCTALTTFQEIKEKVTLNIGGTIFLTSKVTLMADPSSLFTIMMLPQTLLSTNSNMYNVQYTSLTEILHFF